MLDLETVEAAGGLVVNRRNQILFIFKDGRWDLPKGLIEDGEDAGDTALEEVSEETGLPVEQLRVVTELIPTTHVSKFAKKRALKRTRWFLALYNGKDSNFVPQASEGIETCEWISTWDLDRPLANCPIRIRYLIQFWKKVKKEIDYGFEL